MYVGQFITDWGSEMYVTLANYVCVGMHRAAEPVAIREIKAR